MKKVLAAALVAAAFTASAPAMAAKQIDTEVGLTQSAPGVFTGTFSNTVTAADLVGSLYQDTYQFIVPTTGTVGAGAISFTFNGALTFTEVLLNGSALTISETRDGNGNIVSYSAVTPFGGLPSGPNPQRVSVSGRLTGNTGTYTGNVRFESAVPEPGTWALMILGFGVVGYAMRRRTPVRFAQAI